VPLKLILNMFKYKSTSERTADRVEYTWVGVAFLTLYECFTLSAVVLIVHNSHFFFSPTKKYLTFAYAAMEVEHKVSVCVCIENIKSHVHKGLQNKIIV
jgi:hypothetical protein